MTPEQARRAALSTLARVRLGADPQAEKSRQRTTLTVAGLIDAFLADRVAKLKPNTRAAYANLLAKVRQLHGAIKADALTRVQVSTLHRSLSAAPYRRTGWPPPYRVCMVGRKVTALCTRGIATRRRG